MEFETLFTRFLNVNGYSIYGPIQKANQISLFSNFLSTAGSSDFTVKVSWNLIIGLNSISSTIIVLETEKVSFVPNIKGAVNYGGGVSETLKKGRQS